MAELPHGADEECEDQRGERGLLRSQKWSLGDWLAAAVTSLVADKELCLHISWTGSP